LTASFQTLRHHCANISIRAGTIWIYGALFPSPGISGYTAELPREDFTDIKYNINRRNLSIKPCRQYERKELRMNNGLK
jgi:hypothetical protein